TPGLTLYQWMMDKDRSARKQNQQRLRELKHAHASDLDLFCGHDVTEFERLSGRSARVPVQGMALFRLCRDLGVTSKKPCVGLPGRIERWGDGPVPRGYLRSLFSPLSRVVCEAWSPAPSCI